LSGHRIAGLALQQGRLVDEATLTSLSEALDLLPGGTRRQHVAGAVGLAQCGGEPGQPLATGPLALVADGRVAPSDGEDAGTDALQAWRRDGLGFAAGLRGPFALALHDRASRQVALARDPFGMRPLYLAEVPGGGIAFASTPRALLACGLVAPRLRPQARAELLQMQFTTGAETIFEGIHRVLPGETVLVADGAIAARRSCAALPEGGPEPIEEGAALARLDAALAESLPLHAPPRDGRRWGLALSGAADGAVLLAALTGAGQGAAPAPPPPCVFTVAFDAPVEGAMTSLPGALAGARHVPVQVGEAAVWRHLPEIVACMDDPAADHAILLTWFLGRAARAEGVEVLLCGEGVEEVFGGYGRYRALRRPWWLGGKAPRARGSFDRLDVLRDSAALLSGWRDGIAAAEGTASLPGRTRLMAAQALDVADWLPNDLLLRLDRCLSAHGVEGRTPLLDPAVVAAGFRLPDALKVRGHTGRWLLRRWLARRLPGAVAVPPPRQGFATPFGAWIQGAGDRLGPLVAAQPGVAEIARPDRVAALFRHAGETRRGLAAWHLLFYALWHRRHVEGIRVEGADVFEALAPAR
jgi:asparagine synthase (glutamine-hydrolysing)